MNSQLNDLGACPCGSMKSFVECCKPYLYTHKIPGTAKTLMRSRYVAYVLHNERYLLDTWDDRYKPDSDQPIIQTQIQWNRLEILYAKKGSRNDNTGVVAFRAHYTLDAQVGILEEISHFIKKEGKWYYVNGRSI